MTPSLSALARLPGALPAADLERGLASVRAHGWNATAFQTLEPGFRHLAVGDGCVAFVDTGRAWVAAGAPLVATRDLASAAEVFVAHARRAGRRAVLCGVERRFLAHAPTFRALYAGAQPVWDPRAWPETLGRARSVREQLRRARAKGVRVRAAGGPCGPASAEVLDALDALREARAERRPLPALGFLVEVAPRHLAHERRFFVAEREGRAVGVAIGVPVPTRGEAPGWLVEDVVLAADAPNGTSDALVDAAFRAFAAEGASYATLGLAPLAATGRPGEHALRALRALARTGAPLYDVEGQRRFRARLSPDRWDPAWVAYPPESTALRAAADVVDAFVGGSLVRFGLALVARRLRRAKALRPAR